MFKYGYIFGPYFPVFSPNTGNYGSEITLQCFDEKKFTEQLLIKTFFIESKVYDGKCSHTDDEISTEITKCSTALF